MISSGIGASLPPAAIAALNYSSAFPALAPICVASAAVVSTVSVGVFQLAGYCISKIPDCCNLVAKLPVKLQSVAQLVICLGKACLGVTASYGAVQGLVALAPQVPGLAGGAMAALSINPLVAAGVGFSAVLIKLAVDRLV